MSILHKLPAIQKNNQKRVGRGYGSGVGGHTSTRGTKGHTSRTGGKTPLWFEGGQLPLIRRLPWLRGKGRFQSLKKVQEVQLKAVVEKKLQTVTPESLIEAGLFRSSYGEPRLVGAVELASAIKVERVSVTDPVKQAIEKAGGSVTL